MVFSDEKIFDVLVTETLASGAPQISVTVPSKIVGVEQPIENKKRVRYLMCIPSVINSIVNKSSIL